MANPEHVEIVKQGAEAIQEWREANPDAQIDVHESNLRLADLHGANLVRANLLGADLSRANLSGAELGGAYLTEANLNRAFLTGADLTGAYLTDANLSRANLADANMSGAMLVGANLSPANLSNADLRGADLTGAHLTGAILNGTLLSRALMSNTVLAGRHLSDVIGLATVEHLAPSELGLSTLFRSRQEIPEFFLRGCGLPDEFITYLPSLVGSALEFYSCFISYSHGDKSFARRLHDTLQGCGIRCWLDEHAMLPGENIYSAVDRGIRVYDKVLLCCSESSLSSWWVKDEVTKTLSKERELSKARGETVQALIPLNLDGYMLDEAWQAPWRNQVRDRKAADFTGWESDNAKFEAEFEKVVMALRADTGARPPEPEPKL